MPYENRTPHPGQQHPPQWQRDLGPSASAGANYGTEGPHPELDARTAYDDKDLNRALADFSDDELKRIAIIPPGARLEQGATYFDLAHPERGEFTAMSNMSAGPDQRLTLKSAVGYDLWNRLAALSRAPIK